MEYLLHKAFLLWMLLLSLFRNCYMLLLFVLSLFFLSHFVFVWLCVRVCACLLVLLRRPYSSLHQATAANDMSPQACQSLRPANRVMCFK